jgi:hypothetical protein
MSSRYHHGHHGHHGHCGCRTHHHDRCCGTRDYYNDTYINVNLINSYARPLLSYPYANAYPYSSGLYPFGSGASAYRYLLTRGSDYSCCRRY